jgi:hypothetical protein
VLVHCSAGAQRTGACVAFYRLLVRREATPEVYRELMSYAWDPVSNVALTDYVNSHMGELAGLLVEKHVIDRVPDNLPRLGP